MKMHFVTSLGSHEPKAGTALPSLDEARIRIEAHLRRNSNISKDRAGKIVSLGEIEQGEFDGEPRYTENTLARGTSFKGR